MLGTMRATSSSQGERNGRKSRHTTLLPTTASRQRLPHPSRSTSRQPSVAVLRVNNAPRIKVNHLRVATGSTKYCYASALSTQRALTRSSSVTHSARPLGHLSGRRPHQQIQSISASTSTTPNLVDPHID